MTPRELAEAVKTQLESGDFSLTPDSVQRAYSPDIELGRSEELHLIVIPKSMTRERIDETAWDREIAIDIGILYKFKVASSREIPNSLVDEYSDFSQEIANYFCSDDPDESETVYEAPDGLEVIDVVQELLYLPEHLKRLRQFTSVVTILFREVI